MFLHRVDGDLALKLIGPNDADELYQLTDHSRNHLRTWLGWVDSNDSVEDTREFIKNGLRNYAENRGIPACILFRGNIAGIIGTQDTDWTNRSTSIGYWLCEDYIGKGIMTRAVKALTNYLIQELKINRVEIRAAEKNVSSRSIPERLGYTQEGKIRQAEWLYDHYVDHIVYSMLAHEWSK
ncbi:GNAT family N-acetyltransferase [Halobacillus sp. Marseille-P3879]|uniref:GNAT family N-acetyltransferase n=1 Tax=Halobacillus sp. Marseille-P3879 TaxID=2045014 RepID=UPI000C7A9D94|nr:GNAT family protein [Halobacillus sp. Marseille-P3879]